MIVVEKGTVQHNGRLYGPGEIIQGLKKKEAERLVELGACREIADTAPPAQAALAQGEIASPEAAKAAAAVVSPQEDAPEGHVGVENLGLLGIDPAATIRSGK